MGATSATEATWEEEREVNGQEQGGTQRLSNALGWFSIGLGLAQVAAPRGVARFIGVTDDDDSEKLMRMLGMREIAAGVGILSQPRQPGWLWARVAGDVMDLALLSSALRSRENDRGRLTAATAAVVGVTALDAMVGARLNRESAEGAHGEQEKTRTIRHAITINRSVEEVYEFWRNFENLPQFMDHLESVTVIDDRLSHWKTKGPAGKTMEWDAEMTEDILNERIAWRSVEGADVHNAGVVLFTPAPGGRGTEVHVELEYSPPAGKLGVMVAKVFGEEPKQQVRDDLRRFKQVMETGEIVRSSANLGEAHMTHFSDRPAQPLAEAEV